MIPLPLTPKNRLLLAGAFRLSPRVDCSIDCVIEGQMGRAFTDDLDRLAAFCITTGPFWYFAGDAAAPGARRLVQSFPGYTLLMPSPPAWVELAQQVFPLLQALERYQFAVDQLSAPRIEKLLATSKHRNGIFPIDSERAVQLAERPEPYFEIDTFDSVGDFMDRGSGFVSVGSQGIQGAAYTSLVNSKAIEISIFVEERWRERGVGTALASRLVLECLRLGLHPNWDAANPESCKLAQKLGYRLVGPYDAFFYPTA